MGRLGTHQVSHNVSASPQVASGQCQRAQIHRVQQRRTSALYTQTYKDVPKTVEVLPDISLFLTYRKSERRGSVILRAKLECGISVVNCT